MQSTGQTSRQASQPVQLSALITATSLGSFLRAPDLAIAFPAYSRKQSQCVWQSYFRASGAPRQGNLSRGPVFGSSAVVQCWLDPNSLSRAAIGGLLFKYSGP